MSKHGRVKVFKRLFNQSKYLVSFGGNLSGMIVEFKLVIKNNTKFAVCCNNVNRYSVKTVGTTMMDWAKVEVLAFGDVKFQLPPC